MNLDHDQFLLARARLSDIYDELKITSFDSNAMQFLLRLDNIRTTAISHDFIAVAEIASAFEAALHDAIKWGDTKIIIENYMEILQDAIGCSSGKADIIQALLASVANRIGH